MKIIIIYTISKGCTPLQQTPHSPPSDGKPHHLNYHIFCRKPCISIIYIYFCLFVCFTSETQIILFTTSNQQILLGILVCLFYLYKRHLLFSTAISWRLCAVWLCIRFLPLQPLTCPSGPTRATSSTGTWARWCCPCWGPRAAWSPVRWSGLSRSNTQLDTPKRLTGDLMHDGRSWLISQTSTLLSAKTEDASSSTFYITAIKERLYRFNIICSALWAKM